MLLQESQHTARTSAIGDLILLEDQDHFCKKMCCSCRFSTGEAIANANGTLPPMIEPVIYYKVEHLFAGKRTPSLQNRTGDNQ